MVSMDCYRHFLDWKRSIDENFTRMGKWEEINNFIAKKLDSFINK
jgi:hypothetical protein